jgi:hypothetical protein
MTTLTRQRFRVLVDQDGTDVEHELTIIHGDQIRAERSARQRGAGSLKEAGLTHTSLWCWHAMVRLELTTLKYEEWIDTVLQLSPVKDAAGAPVSEPVDPTQRAELTGPPSSSPASSAASSDGSTPTSTTSSSPQPSSSSVLEQIEEVLSE